MASDNLDKPGEPPCLQIPVGSACQNRCRFCIDGAHQGVSGPDDEAIRRMLEENRGLPEVLFSRFEPTLNPGLVRWAGWARELGYTKISLISNGRRLRRPGFAARLAEAGISSFVVSLHGHRPEVHDRLTGRPGSFAQTVAGLEALQRLRDQVDLELRIVTTACAWNVEHLPAIHGFVRRFAPDGAGWNALLLAGRALERADELAVEYPRLVESLRRCLEAYPEAPPGLTNVPLCFALHRVPPGLLRGEEDTRLGEVDRHGGLVEASAKRFTRSHVYHPDCAGCVVRAACGGLSPHYVDRFGWEGVTPISAEALARAEREGAKLLEPRPFVSADQLRRLIAPPGQQWEILDLRVGPTDAFVHLRARRPDELHVHLVLTPRSAHQPAYRRTRRFNVALGGRDHSRREEAMAAAITRWIQHGERREAPPHVK